MLQVAQMSHANTLQTERSALSMLYSWSWSSSQATWRFQVANPQQACCRLAAVRCVACARSRICSAVAACTVTLLWFYALLPRRVRLLNRYNCSRDASWTAFSEFGGSATSQHVLQRRGRSVTPRSPRKCLTSTQRYQRLIHGLLVIIYLLKVYPLVVVW